MVWSREARPSKFIFGYLPSLFAFVPIGFDTTCKDYDSINQQSRPSTPTTGPRRGGGEQTMTMPGGEGDERHWSLYICILMSSTPPLDAGRHKALSLGLSLVQIEPHIECAIQKGATRLIELHMVTGL